MEVGRQEKWQAEQKGRVRIDGRVCRDREPLCWKLWPSQTGSPAWTGILGCREGSHGRCSFPGPVQLRTALIKGMFGQMGKVGDQESFRQT